eukprot:TRINITY_DN2764_c0_g2_i3.p1 TRINITY_DN2764_c0_g2~~TRINITY_DN2764_c0_g2_i3.p1  ORF type:complete len:968 (-),score=371.61 TRINITY_DN2764_c0_g2_i3:39-2822(-)
MQAKRDPEFEKNLLKWVEEVVGEKATHPEDFGESLKTGTMLCKLINVVAPASVKKVDMRNIALVHVENINAYLKACWNIGLPSSELFITSDLYGKKGIPQVVQNVFGVAKLAQSKPTWTGPLFGEVPKVKQINLTPAKKWEPVKTDKQMRRVEDIEAELQAGEGDAMRIKDLEAELAELREKIHRNEVDKQSLAQRENALTQENKQLKDRVSQAQKENETATKSLQKANTDLKEANQTIETLKKNSAAAQSAQNAAVAKPKEAEVDPALLKQLRDRVEQLEKQLSAEKEQTRQQKQLVKKIQKELELEKQTKKDMAIQRQATINNLTLRKGSKEKPQTVESLEAEKAADALSDLSKLLHRIFFGKATDISTSDYLRFDSALQDELARRFFAKQLSKNLKQTAHYELQAGEFKCIEHLTSTCLREMMAASSDFITGKQIMRSGNKVNCKSEGTTNTFLRDSIKDFEIFSVPEFWHDCFIDELNKKYHRFFPQDSGHAVDVDFVTTLTSSFVLQMGEWKVKDSVIDRFIHEIPHNNHVGIKDPKELEARLEGFWVQAKHRQARYSQVLPGSPLASFSRSFTTTSTPGVTNPQMSQSLSSIPAALLDEAKSPNSRRKSTRFTGVNELRDSRAKKFTSTKEIPPGNPIKIGTLSVKVTLGWKSRTVMLKDNFLLILKDQKSSKAETIIPLYYAQVAPSDKKGFAFVVGESYINRDTHVYISSPTEKERQEWIAAVQQAITQSQVPTPDSPSMEREPTPDSARTAANVVTPAAQEPTPVSVPQNRVSNPTPPAVVVEPTPAPTPARANSSAPTPTPVPTPSNNSQNANPTPSSPTPVRATSASAPPAVAAAKGISMAPKPNPASITWVKLKAKATESHTSTDPKELKISEGDILQITKQDNGGWWFGYVEGKEALKGWIPSIKLKQETSYLR